MASDKQPQRGDYNISLDSRQTRQTFNERLIQKSRSTSEELESEHDELEDEVLESEELESEHDELEDEVLESEELESEHDELEDEVLEDEELESEHDELEDEVLESEELESEHDELEDEVLEDEELESEELESEHEELEREELEPSVELSKSKSTSEELESEHEELESEELELSVELSILSHRGGFSDATRDGHESNAGAFRIGHQGDTADIQDGRFSTEIPDSQSPDPGNASQKSKETTRLSTRSTGQRSLKTIDSRPQISQPRRSPAQSGFQATFTGHPGFQSRLRTSSGNAGSEAAQAPLFGKGSNPVTETAGPSSLPPQAAKFLSQQAKSGDRVASVKNGVDPPRARGPALRRLLPNPNQIVLKTNNQNSQGKSDREVSSGQRKALQRPSTRKKKRVPKYEAQLANAFNGKSVYTDKKKRPAVPIVQTEGTFGLLIPSQEQTEPTAPKRPRVTRGKTTRRCGNHTFQVPVYSNPRSMEPKAKSYSHYNPDVAIPSIEVDDESTLSFVQESFDAGVDNTTNVRQDNIVRNDQTASQIASYDDGGFYAVNAESSRVFISQQPARTGLHFTTTSQNNSALSPIDLRSPSSSRSSTSSATLPPQDSTPAAASLQSCSLSIKTLPLPKKDYTLSVNPTMESQTPRSPNSTGGPSNLMMQTQPVNGSQYSQPIDATNNMSAMDDHNIGESRVDHAARAARIQTEEHLRRAFEAAQEPNYETMRGENTAALSGLTSEEKDEIILNQHLELWGVRSIAPPAPMPDAGWDSFLAADQARVVEQDGRFDHFSGDNYPPPPPFPSYEHPMATRSGPSPYRQQINLADPLTGMMNTSTVPPITRGADSYAPRGTVGNTAKVQRHKPYPSMIIPDLRAEIQRRGLRQPSQRTSKSELVIILQKDDEKKAGPATNAFSQQPTDAYDSNSVISLLAIARERNIRNISRDHKHKIIDRLREYDRANPPAPPATGQLPSHGGSTQGGEVESPSQADMFWDNLHSGNTNGGDEDPMAVDGEEDDEEYDDGSLFGDSEYPQL